MKIMLDCNRRSYLYVKQGNKHNHLIPLDAAGLSVVQLSNHQMNELGITELEGYPLDRALEVFRRSAVNFGATQEVQRYLEI